MAGNWFVTGATVTTGGAPSTDVGGLDTDAWTTTLAGGFTYETETNGVPTPGTDASAPAGKRAGACLARAAEED